MKLNEIFEPEIATVNDNPKVGNYIGGGYFSDAYDNDEHTVTKVSKNHYLAKADKYWKYVDRLIKTEIWKGNPFFPRIYSIKKHYDKEYDETIYSGTLERLIPYKEIETDILKQYISSLIDHPNFKFVQENDKFILSNKDVMTRMGYAIEHMIEAGGMIDNISNDSFREAIEWFRENNDMGSNYDIHAGNMMFRRGNVGIQLVITDPLSD